MTDKTTRIWVDLTDEQMDYIDNNWGYMGSSHRTMGTIRDAVKAQRPRPIAVGDRVRTGEGHEGEVHALHNDRAWIWDGHLFVGTCPVPNLTRVDDEETKTNERENS